MKKKKINFENFLKMANVRLLPLLSPLCSGSWKIIFSLSNITIFIPTQYQKMVPRVPVPLKVDLLISPLLIGPLFTREDIVLV